MTLFGEKAGSSDMFNRIAGSYDLLNRVLSFGMDQVWRARAASFLKAGSSRKILDIASGTGDLALYLARVLPGDLICAVDLADAMLAVASRKIFLTRLKGRVCLIKADAQQLPFADHVFHGVTVSFGLRNMPDLMRALAEAERVLKPGGRLVILEFSKPQGTLKPFHAFYMKFIVPGIGGILTGDGQAYSYLSRTVDQFPYGERLERIIRQAGFVFVMRQSLFFGTASIYVAEKRP